MPELSFSFFLYLADEETERTRVPQSIQPEQRRTGVPTAAPFSMLRQYKRAEATRGAQFAIYQYDVGFLSRARGFSSPLSHLFTPSKLANKLSGIRYP